MSPDALSVVLRALAFGAALQAVGGLSFLCLFARHVPASHGAIRRLIGLASIAGAGFFLAHGLVEPARMAGEYFGILDPALQKIVFTSSTGLVVGLRVLGLLLLGLTMRPTVPSGIGAIGALLIIGSFALVGHTAVHPQRVVLAPLLFAHVAIVAFWFGSLAPLHLATARESPADATAVVAAFSKTAAYLVPVIFLAGLVLTWMLLPRVDSLLAPYGRLILFKVTIFAVLMALASLNKWRFGPAMSAGDPRARSRFRCAVVAEGMLIAAVLLATVVLTSFYSPEP